MRKIRGIVNTVFKSILIVIITSCESLIFDKHEKNPVAVFDHFWSTMDEYYANFDERGIDWQKEYDNYRPLINKITKEDRLYNVIGEIITKLNDGHVTLTAPNKKVYESNEYYRNRVGYDLFDIDVIKENYLDVNYVETGYNKDFYGTINDKILYVHFSNTRENLLTIDDVIAHMPDAKGIIVDLRHNTGGNFIYPFRYFKRFNDDERLVFSSRTKTGSGYNDFSDWHEWYLEGNGDFKEPIAVLTDRYTISAAERAVMLFKTLPQATIIGDTTNGSLSNMIGRELANGWYISLATQKTKYANGEMYEGKGVPPDISATNSRTRIEVGKDDVLEIAIGLF